MNIRNWITAGIAAFLLAACSTGPWQVAYESNLSTTQTRDWRLADVIVAVPSNLTVSNNNTFAPNADIVWHGEPFGDRRAQVAAIFDEGVTSGGSSLRGRRPVTLTVQTIQFHAVTPAAVARAPSAVHNIKYLIQVRDAASGAPLTDTVTIAADLEANVGPAAITAAINGEDQRSRIVDHLARVTRGWLGTGPDQRRTFSSIGR